LQQVGIKYYVYNIVARKMYNMKPVFISILLNVLKSSFLEMVLGDRCTTFKLALLSFFGLRGCGV